MYIIFLQQMRKTQQQLVSFSYVIYYFMNIGGTCCCFSSSVGDSKFVLGTDVQGELSPRGQISKGDFCPRRLFSKEAFNSDKLARIIFFILYWILRY